MARTWILDRDGAPKLGFHGERLVRVQSYHKMIDIYETKRGMFVAYTQRTDDGRGRKTAVWKETLADLLDALPPSRLVKQLRIRLDLNATEEVE